MRDFLTGIAIILIVALTTMLVAPYFVDWNGQRGFLETQLTRALGQKVTIGGNIDLKLLPTPYLRLNQTVIGRDDGPVKIGIRSLDLELAVAPLLHGEIDIVEGRLEDPTIRVTLQPDRTLPALPDTPALRANVRLERVTVVDGTLALADPQSGRTIVLDHLDFGVEAPALAGPFRGSGTQGAPNARTKFRFSTTEARAGKTKLHLALDETPAHPALDLDGDVTLRSQGADTVRQSFDGTVVASGHVLDAVESPISWRLSGPLKADPHSATFGDGEFKIGGATDDGLTFAAAGDAVFGEAPAARIKLDGKQLDIDRLAGPPVDGTRPPPPKLPSLAVLRRLLTATPPIPTIVDVAADGAVWGGEALSGLTAHAALGTTAPHAVTLAGDGPGGLHLDLDGALTAGGGFDGRLNLAADDLPLALRWIATVVPDLHVPRRLPARSASLRTHLVAGANGLDLNDLALGLDRSKLTGSAHVAFADTGPTTLSADLKTAMLDLDTLPDLRAMEDQADAVDLGLKLDAGAVRIARVGNGPLASGHVRLDLTAAGTHVAIGKFEADNLGGATVRASGNLDATSAALTLHVDAARLEQAAALVRQLAPGRASDALVSRAGDLAPAALEVTASFSAARKKLAPSRIDASGHFATTQVEVHLAPDPSGDGVVLDAKAATPHGGTLLRQLGLPSLPIDLVGASSVTIAAKGAVDHRLDTKMDAALGATHLLVDGRFDLFGTGQGGSGTVTLSSPNTAPLLQTLAISPLDLTARLPAAATAGLAIGQAGLAISDIKGRIDDAGVAGTLKWQSATGDGPALTGALDFDRLALGALFGFALGPTRPAPLGAIWSSEPFAASLVDPPRSAVALRVKTLDLGFGLLARDATFDLGVAPNLVTLKRGGATPRPRPRRVQRRLASRRHPGCLGRINERRQGRARSAGDQGHCGRQTRRRRQAANRRSRWCRASPGRGTRPSPARAWMASTRRPSPACSPRWKTTRSPSTRRASCVPSSIRRKGRSPPAADGSA